jgi:conjugal transfer/entry exclusion protein
LNNPLSEAEMTLLSGQLINLHRVIQNVQQLEAHIHNQLKNVVGKSSLLQHSFEW